MEDPRLVFVSHQCKHELCDVSLTPAAVLNLSEITENYNRLPDDEARAGLQADRTASGHANNRIVFKF